MVRILAWSQSSLPRNSEPADSAVQGDFDRTVLPIPEPKLPTYTEVDATKVRPPRRFEVKAPAGARYTSVDQIIAKDLKRWRQKSIDIQWDYKNIVKRKGKLVRLK